MNHFHSFLLLSLLFIGFNFHSALAQTCWGDNECRDHPCRSGYIYYCSKSSSSSYFGSCDCKRISSSSSSIAWAFIIPAIIVPVICILIVIGVAIKFCVTKRRRDRELREANEALTRQRQQQIAVNMPQAVVQTHYIHPEPHNTTNYPVHSAHVHQGVYPQPNNYAQPTTGGFAANPIPQPYPQNQPYPQGQPQPQPYSSYQNPYPDGVPPNVSVIPPYNPDYKPDHNSTIS